MIGCRKDLWESFSYSQFSLFCFSNNSILVDGISRSSIVAQRADSSPMGFLSNTRKIRTSKSYRTERYPLLSKLPTRQGCGHRTSFSHGTRRNHRGRSLALHASKYQPKPNHSTSLSNKGIEGKFIKTPSLTDKQAQRSFHIDRSLGTAMPVISRGECWSRLWCYLDATLRDLARRMVPLCSNHSLIVRFIEGTPCADDGTRNFDAPFSSRSLTIQIRFDQPCAGRSFARSSPSKERCPCTRRVSFCIWI